MANKVSAVKVRMKDGVATVRMAFSHPMTTYNQAKTKTGNSDDANFITHITAKVKDQVVFDASTSQFFSRNPILLFNFKVDSFKIGRKLSGRELDNGVKRKDSEKGDLLTVVATDRKGNTYKKSVELASRK